jgi:two-component system LytT family response regulator
MTTRIRAIVVDDEPLARDGLRLLLGAMSDVEIVGEAGDGATAVRAIGTLCPDVVLLDVQMPGLSGFDVVEQTASSHLPLIVFVTAYDEYALRAFEVHAFDYLLKPVNPTRLAETMTRVRADLERGGLGRERVMDVVDSVRLAQSGRTEDRPAERARHVVRFAVRDRDRYVLVRAADIEWVEAAANYVRLNTRGHGFLLRMTLADMERKLDPAQFTRIHRSTIVNTSRVREIKPDAHGDYDVVLLDGRTLRMSRSFRERLLGR